MPQFDPSHFASQIFWLAISFALLYWLLQKLVIPQIGQVIEQRATRIAEDLALASRVRTDADALVATYEAALQKARGEAAAVLSAAAQENARTAAERQQAFGAELGAKVSAAEGRIGEAKRAALAHVREIATGVTADITARLGVPAGDRTAVAAAVDDAMRSRAA